MSSSQPLPVLARVLVFVDPRGGDAPALGLVQAVRTALAAVPPPTPLLALQHVPNATDDNSGDVTRPVTPILVGGPLPPAVAAHVSAAVNRSSSLVVGVCLQHEWAGTTRFGVALLRGLVAGDTTAACGATASRMLTAVPALCSPRTTADAIYATILRTHAQVVAAALLHAPRAGAVSVPLAALGPLLCLGVRTCCSKAARRRPAPVPPTAEPPTAAPHVEGGVCLGCGAPVHDFVDLAMSPQGPLHVALLPPSDQPAPEEQRGFETEMLVGVAHSRDRRPHRTSPQGDTEGFRDATTGATTVVVVRAFQCGGEVPSVYALQTDVRGQKYLLATTSTSAFAAPVGEDGSDTVDQEEGPLDGDCTLCTAILANRESSTHANQVVPRDGVVLTVGRSLALTRGGLVGESTGAASASANPLAQKALQFDVIGRLVIRQRAAHGDTHDDTPLSSHHLKRPLRLVEEGEVPVEGTVEGTPVGGPPLPVIVVGGTSAEAGKSTFCRKLLQALGPARRVAYIKATGTSSWGDTIQAEAAGAWRVYDQLDCGLPTTYTNDPAAVTRALPAAFAHAAADGADCVLCELGGDLIWAHNPLLLAAPWLAARVQALFVIANDTLAAMGTHAFLQHHLPATAAVRGSLLARLHMVASPFRTYDGACARAAAFGLDTPVDPNISPDALKAILTTLLADCANPQDQGQQRHP